MEIVINKCFGGFSISKKCAEYMVELGSERAKAELDEYYKTVAAIKQYGDTGTFPYYVEESEKDFIKIYAKYRDFDHWYGFGYCDGYEEGYERNDPILVKAVKDLGRDADGSCSDLEVVEIPDGIEWEIEEYDGMESVHEAHRSWG